jgi:hypothetical protein
MRESRTVACPSDIGLDKQVDHISFVFWDSENVSRPGQCIGGLEDVKLQVVNRGIETCANPGYSSKLQGAQDTPQVRPHRHFWYSTYTRDDHYASSNYIRSRSTHSTADCRSASLVVSSSSSTKPKKNFFSPHQGSAKISKSHELIVVL